MKAQTPEKSQLIADIQTHITNKLTAYELAILMELVKPDRDEEGLLECLRSQQRDNWGVMVGVIGFDNSEQLEKILP